MKNYRNVTALAFLITLTGCSDAAEEESTTASADEHAHHAEAAGPAMPAVPAGASVSFLAPEEGDTLVGEGASDGVTVALEFGAENIEIGPAGEVQAGFGHHHVLIDAEAAPSGEAVPADDTHIHYGGGQTSAKIQLSPGDHTLTLQLADGLHRSYGPALSSTIHVHVKASAGGE